jgi:hypothetical protein
MTIDREPFSREDDIALAIQQARTWAEIAAAPQLSKVPVTQEEAAWHAAHWASVVTSNEWVRANEG